MVSREFLHFSSYCKTLADRLEHTGCTHKSPYFVYDVLSLICYPPRITVRSRRFSKRSLRSAVDCIMKSGRHVHLPQIRRIPPRWEISRCRTLGRKRNPRPEELERFVKVTAISRSTRNFLYSQSVDCLRNWLQLTDETRNLLNGVTYAWCLCTYRTVYVLPVLGPNCECVGTSTKLWARCLCGDWCGECVHKTWHWKIHFPVVQARNNDVLNTVFETDCNWPMRHGISDGSELSWLTGENYWTKRKLNWAPSKCHENSNLNLSELHLVSPHVFENPCETAEGGGVTKQGTLRELYAALCLMQGFCVAKFPIICLQCTRCVRKIRGLFELRGSS